jgi:hypothetical protein
MRPSGRLSSMPRQSSSLAPVSRSIPTSDTLFAAITSSLSDQCLVWHSVFRSRHCYGLALSSLSVHQCSTSTSVYNAFTRCLDFGRAAQQSRIGGYFPTNILSAHVGSILTGASPYQGARYTCVYNVHHIWIYMHFIVSINILGTHVRSIILLPLHRYSKSHGTIVCTMYNIFLSLCALHI